MSPAAFLAAQIVITAVGVLAGALVALRRVRRELPVGPFSVAWAGVWTVAGATGATILGSPVGISAFGMIRMVYLAGVVGVPAVGLGLLAAHAAGRVRLTRAAAPVVALGLLLAPLGAWISFVEPQMLRVESVEVPLPAARRGAAPVRVGVLADLQCDSVGAFEERVVDALMAERPDLIIVPGDIFQPQLDRVTELGRHRDALAALLSRVTAPHGVYFVPGDVDAADTLEIIREATDWRVLLNETVTRQVGDRTLTIAGMMNRASHEVAHALERREGTDDVRILVCHAPDIVLSLEGAPRADLIVAGHTHGGQLVVPGFGPPMTLSRVPRHIAAGGLHEHDGRRIYVSRGAGLERNQAPPMRFLCPPEVTVLTLSGPPPERP